MRFLAILLLCGACSAVQAHSASDAFLEIRPADGAIAVRWDIALRDLDQVLELDRNGDEKLQWGEVDRQRMAIADYARRAIDFATATGDCAPGPMSLQLARRGGDTYASLSWRAACPGLAADLQVGYRLLLKADPTHRAIVSVSGSGIGIHNLRPSDTMQTLVLRDVYGATSGYDLTGFFLEGCRHILDGWDHLAFLLALLIPLMAGAASGNRALRTLLPELLTVVSVFTLAHSITLGLTALGVISLPSRLVESLIALSVVFAGAQGFMAAARGRRSALAASGKAQPDSRSPAVAVPLWLVFSFGLVHGMGFGSALSGAGLDGRSVIAALLGFNVGVEAGQLAVLVLVFPLAWALRKAQVFNRVLLPAASLAIVAAGIAWFSGRAFDVDLIGILSVS